MLLEPEMWAGWSSNSDNVAALTLNRELLKQMMVAP